MPRNDRIRPRPAPIDNRAVVTLRRSFQALLSGKRPTMYQRQLRDLAAVLTVRAQAAAINADVHPDALMKAVAMARNARQDMLLAFGLPTTALTDVPASLSAPAVLPLGELIDRTRQAERARA